MKIDEYALLNEATKFLRKNKPAEAAELYQKIGDIFYQQCFYQKALAAYQKAFSLGLRDQQEILLNIANTYEKINRPFAAFEFLKLVLAHHLQNKLLEQALEMALKMSFLQKEDYYAYEKLGEIHFKLGHHNEASGQFKKAYEKAAALALNQKALLFLYTAFKFQPKDVNIWHQLKILLETMHGSHHPNVIKIAAQLEGKSLSHISKVSSFQWKKEMEDAKLLLEENLFDAAEKKYEAILKQSPGNKRVQAALNNALKLKEIRVGKKAPSAEDLMRSLEEDLGSQDDSDKSNISFQIETPEDQLDSKSFYELAIAYKEMDLFEDAISLLQKVLKEKIPFKFKLHCSILMGTCYVDNKQYFEAISQLENTLYQSDISFEKLPTDERLALLYTVGKAYDRSGNVNKALSSLRKIEKEDKHYRDISDWIKNLRVKLSS